MCFFFNHHEQVACHTIVLAGITLATYGELHAFGYTGRDFYFHHFFAVGDTFARAVLALFLDDLSFTVTIRTDGLSLHHAEDALLGAGYATCTMAVRTSFCTRVAFSTTSVTMFTYYIFLQLELLFHTGSDVLQVKLHLYAEV